MPNFVQIGQGVAQKWPFSIFQDGGRPPSWIFKSWKFSLPIPFGGPKCGTVSNFVQIVQTDVEIWRFFDFQDGGRPPSWIFKSWKFSLPIPFGGPKCVIMPNFMQIGQGVAEIWPFLFFFSRWRVRHLGFVIRLFGPPTKCILVVTVTVQNLV